LLSLLVINNGIIIQWGYHTLPGSGTGLWPIAFNKFLQVVGNYYGYIAYTANFYHLLYNPTATGYSWYPLDQDMGNYSYLTIGY